MKSRIYDLFSLWRDWGGGGGRVVRRCWVKCQCRGVLLIWIIVGQGPIALAVGAGGGCLDFFSPVYLFSFSFSLSERRPDIDRNTVLKGHSTQNNQPTSSMA